MVQRDVTDFDGNYAQFVAMLKSMVNGDLRDDTWIAFTELEGSILVEVSNPPPRWFAGYVCRAGGIPVNFTDAHNEVMVAINGIFEEAAWEFEHEAFDQFMSRLTAFVAKATPGQVLTLSESTTENACINVRLIRLADDFDPSVN